MPKIYQGVTIELSLFGKMKLKEDEIKHAVEERIPGASVSFVRSLSFHLGDKIHLESVNVTSAKPGPSEADTAVILTSELMGFLESLERRLKNESKA